LPKDVLEWIVTVLRERHRDEKAFHDETIGWRQAEYSRLQGRIGAMYVDKLDGRIDNVFFDRKSAEWRAEQDRILRDIETHQSANRTYIEEGVQLLRLADRAHALFERQKPAEKRRVLNFVFSNCVWKEGLLSAEYRQPFDMLALAREAAGDQVACENADFRLGVSAEQGHLRSLRCGSDRFRAFGWRRSDHIQNGLDVRPVGRPAFHQASRALFQQLLVAGRRLRRPFVDRREQGQAELQAIAPSLNASACSSSLNQDQRPGQATYCAIALHRVAHRPRQIRPELAHDQRALLVPLLANLLLYAKT
jgi:hypothetical protein